MKKPHGGKAVGSYRLRRRLYRQTEHEAAGEISVDQRLNLVAFVVTEVQEAHRELVQPTREALVPRNPGFAFHRLASGMQLEADDE